MITVHDFDTNNFFNKLLTNEIVKNLEIGRQTTIHGKPITINATKVEIFPDEINPKAVAVTFEDNDVQRAEVSGDDTFNFETGITICIAKHILHLMFSSCSGSSLLNNAVRKAIRTYNISKKKKIAAENLAKQRAERAQRRHDKRKAKREEAAFAFKEKMIEIQKEAYLRAMRELNSATEDNPNSGITETNSKWDETKDKDGNEISYSIATRGFGTPMDNNMIASKCLGMTYLDKNTGYVYHAKPYNGNMSNIQWIKIDELMKITESHE